MTTAPWHSTWVAFLALAAFAGCDGQDALGPRPELRVTASASLTATAVWYDRIDLAWQDNASNESGWEVHRSTTGSSGAFTLYSQFGANTTTASYSGLTPSTEFCFKVRSVKVSGRRTTYGAFSNVACATTLTPPVNAPSGLEATPTGSSSVLITWVDNATNEQGFKVERAATRTGPWEGVILLLYPDANRYGDGSATSEREACYRVVAFNAEGSSLPSNVDCTAPPAAPTMLDGTAEDAQTVVLSWVDNSAVEDGYEVLRSDGNSSAVATLPANSTMFRDAGLAGNLTYGYMVRAIKDGGRSYPSNAIAVPVGVLTPPTAPALDQPVGYFFGLISLSWRDGPNNQEGYKVERCDAGTCADDADYTVVATTGPTARSLMDVFWGGTFRIRATNRLGDSPPSNAMQGRACIEGIDWEAPCFP